MTYTGDVTPGGPADVRELSQLTIAKLAVDEKMSNNCYLLTCRATGAQALIDAADDAPALLELADGALDAVITTHQHWDHHRALAEVVEATGAPVYAGVPDVEAITEQTGVTVTNPVSHGDRIAVGDV
ncbi:MBL fold metallo-hydrolase, partial [Nocardioides dubius]